MKYLAKYLAIPARFILVKKWTSKHLGKRRRLIFLVLRHFLPWILLLNLCFCLKILQVAGKVFAVRCLGISGGVQNLLYDQNLLDNHSNIF